MGGEAWGGVGEAVRGEVKLGSQPQPSVGSLVGVVLHLCDVIMYNFRRVVSVNYYKILKN